MADEINVKINLMVEVINKQMDKVNKATERFGGNIDKATMSNKKFITTMLSTMFAAQKLSQFFNGLLFPAMQMAGIFDLVSQILAVLFLPAVLLLIDPLLKVFDWVTSLDPATQTFIGTLALLAAGVTAVVAAFAPLILAFTQLQDTKFMWDAIFGKGAFENDLSGMGTFLRNAWGTMKGLIAAGLIFKALWDVGEFMEGKKKFSDMIIGVGTELSLAGWIFTGNKWLLTLAISFQLLGFGRQVQAFGENLMKKGFEMQDSVNPAEAMLGGFYTSLGLVIASLGNLAGMGNDFLTQFDAKTNEVNKNTDKFAQSMQEGWGLTGAKIKDSTDKVADFSLKFQDSSGYIKQNINVDLIPAIGALNTEIDSGTKKIYEQANAYDAVYNKLSKIGQIAGSAYFSDLPGGGSAFGGSPVYHSEFNNNIKVSVNTDQNSNYRVGVTST